MFMKRISMVLCLLVAACGDGADGEPTPEPLAYKDMSFEQREAFMYNVVLPQMKETFVAFDAKFETMDCQTCHGDGVTDRSFAMPSPQIAPLPGTEEEFFQAIMDDPEFARWSEFMMNQAWPQMANLLQVPAYDPNTAPDGFSCSNCHTNKAAGGTP